MDENFNEKQDSSTQEERKEVNNESAENNNSSVNDAQTKKIVCSLSYLFGLLFFIPLIMYPNDRVAKFHANQSLAILLVTIIGEALFGVFCGVFAGVAFLGALFGALCGIFGLLILIACIYCIVCVINGEEKELPLIGKFKLIK